VRHLPEKTTYVKGDYLAVYRTADDAYKVRNMGQNPRIAPTMVQVAVKWPRRVVPCDKVPDPLDTNFVKRIYLFDGAEYDAERGIHLLFYREQVL
jgi:hypothetical protein